MRKYRVARRRLKSREKRTSDFIYLLTEFIMIPTFVKKHITRLQNWQPRRGVSNCHQSRGVVLMPAWFCVGLRAMRPPNNQSLTRLAATLPPAPTAPTSSLAQQRSQHWLRPPSRRAAKLWHVGFASILLNYPSDQESFSRSWIDKLPGPVFRRHARRRDLEARQWRGTPVTKMRRGKSN